MKFLVVGYGSIGRRHLGNLRSLSAGELMVFDIDRERCREAEEKYGAQSFSVFEDALTQGPDAVLICTPTSLHMHYARPALLSGCHVFIEKPLSHSAEGVDELIAIASARDRLVFTGYNFRFHWGLKLVKQLIGDGQIGKVLFARAQFGHYLPHWHPWEDYRQGYSARRALGGGIILDSIHELDYFYWFFGKVREVFCLADKLSDLEIDVEDVAEIILRFENGIVGQVHLDYIQSAYDRSLKIVGQEGVITWSFQENSVAWNLRGETAWHIRQKNVPYDVNEMYVEEMAHFVRCIRGEERPLVNGDEGKHTLDIALAAKKSSEIREPVIL